jgi:hypothetical protein
VCGPQLPEILCDRPNVETVRPGRLAAVSPAERASREELLRIADTYYEAIVQSDGHVGLFADDCVRHENGGRANLRSAEQRSAGLVAGGNPVGETANTLWCHEQMNARLELHHEHLAPHADRRSRDGSGVRTIHILPTRSEASRTIVGISGIESVDQSKSQPDSRLWAHVFKVSGGKIHGIEAMSGVPLPIDSKHGWETD